MPSPETGGRCATSENTRMIRRPFLLLVGSIVLLSVYYAGYRPSSSHSKHKLKYPVTIPTIVAFQREQTNLEGNCTSSQPTNMFHHSWQKQNPGWYLYSAHLDNRTGTSLVRIVALSEGDPSGLLFCRIWPDSTLTPVRKTELWIQAWDAAAPGRYLHPYLLSCQASVTVHAVSVVSDPCQKPTNLLNVTSINPKESAKTFGVCLKPIDFSEDISSRLLEWLELQFLLGADSILIYVHNLHPGTRRVLEHYARKVTIVNHSPPTTDRKTNWTCLWQKRRLEVALYNDCFYRHASSHLFVVNLDLDEAIVPVIHNKWVDLLAEPALLSSASVSARNVYFFDSLGVDPSIPDHLHMLRHVYRSANFTPSGFAQKSFFNTRYTEAVAHHYALRALLQPGGIRLMSGLDLRRARLHHYRSQCPKLMEKQCADDFMRYRVKDTALWRFRGALEAAVKRRRLELGMETQQFTKDITATGSQRFEISKAQNSH